MVEKIKPCPFCGEIPKLIHISKNGEAGSQIVCCNCGVVGKWFSVSHTYSSDDRAIEAWNRRTSDGKR